MFHLVLYAVTSFIIFRKVAVVNILTGYLVRKENAKKKNEISYGLVTNRTFGIPVMIPEKRSKAVSSCHVFAKEFQMRLDALN